MSNYLSFFDELKQFLIANKLDTASHIEGANIKDIENGLGKTINEIPAAYVAFLKVFGKNHAECAFGLDLILDSRPYDKEGAEEINADLANNTNVIVIGFRAGSLALYSAVENGVLNEKSFNVGSGFYFIECGIENPPVKVFYEDDQGGGIEEVYKYFTAFVRELAFSAAESLWSLSNDSNKIPFGSIYRWPQSNQLNQEIRQLRYLFVKQIETSETQSNQVNLGAYQQQWETFFENSDFYKLHAHHYSKYRKPYYFPSKASLFQAIKKLL